MNRGEWEYLAPGGYNLLGLSARDDLAYVEITSFGLTDCSTIVDLPVSELWRLADWINEKWPRVGVVHCWPLKTEET